MIHQEGKEVNEETPSGQAKQAQGHTDTGRESKAPAVTAVTNPWASAAGGMLPTHIPQDWLPHKFPGHLCPTLLLSKP